MRLPYLLLTIVVLTAAGRAAATSCSEPPWSNDYSSPLEGAAVVPLDAHPWRIDSCYSGAPAKPADCKFIDNDTQDVIAAEVEMTDPAACDLEYGALPNDASASVIFTFIPATPLTPSHNYRVVCDDGDFSSAKGTVQVRDNDTASAPPTALKLIEARYSRDDNGCCGHGDDIEIEVDGLDGAYLQEGGYIEAALSTGQRFVYVGDPEKIVAPAGADRVTLTPVSASGARGESIEIDVDDIDGDLVYIPCSIGTRTPPAALWLLAPFAWIFAHGQRRRRAV